MLLGHFVGHSSIQPWYFGPSSSWSFFYPPLTLRRSLFFVLALWCHIHPWCFPRWAISRMNVVCFFVVGALRRSLFYVNWLCDALFIWRTRSEYVTQICRFDNKPEGPETQQNLLLYIPCCQKTQQNLPNYILLWVFLRCSDYFFVLQKMLKLRPDKATQI